MNMSNDVKTTVAAFVAAACIVANHFVGKMIPAEVQAAIVTMIGCAIAAFGYFSNKPDVK